MYSVDKSDSSGKTSDLLFGSDFNVTDNVLSKTFLITTCTVPVKNQRKNIKKWLHKNVNMKVQWMRFFDLLT